MYGIAGLLTGRTLAGRYRIDAVIGRGGMGAVYRATDERLGREVAVKVIGAATTDPVEHSRLRARFHREARAAAAIRHPNVVQVHDYGTDPEVDLDFLVMELLHGEDLAVRLTRLGPPSPHVALPLLRQAARGLAAGHRQGLVHRDVKPGNLFLEEDDATGELRVRVLDFGIAAVQAEEGGTMTHLTQVGCAPFSPAYAPPEQLRGEGAVGPASDVFSLGAVGYHLFTGIRPFTSSDPTRASLEVADAVMKLRERARALPEPIYAALVRALSRNPADRYPEAGAFAEALGGSAGSEGAPRATARPAPAPGDHTLLAEADHTRMMQPEPRPTTMRTPPAPVQVRQMAWAPPLPGSHDPTPVPTEGWPGQSAPGHVIQVPQPPSALRRGLRALWNATLTMLALALFAGAWVGAADGVVKDDREQIYAAALATIFLTPLAVHRLAGRHGRLRYAIFAALLATVTAVRTVGLEGDPAIALAAVFGLQIVACFGMEWLTGRKPRTPVVTELR